MVAWNEYRDMARDRGALALELYVVESVPGAELDKVKENLADHLGYQRELEERGVLVLAGPLSDTDGKIMSGAGLIIYRAASMEDAAKLAAGDPMHVSGARTWTLRKWLVNEGSLNVKVGLSTAQVQLS